MSYKRERSSNFTENEVKLLLDLVAAHISILETKKIDYVTNKEKELCWERITNIFNSSTDDAPRSIKVLRMKFENMKKKLKKKITENEIKVLESKCNETPDLKNLTISEQRLKDVLFLASEGLASCLNMDGDTSEIYSIFVNGADKESEHENTEVEINSTEHSDKKNVNIILNNDETKSTNWLKWNSDIYKKNAFSTVSPRNLLSVDSNESELPVSISQERIHKHPKKKTKNYQNLSKDVTNTQYCSMLEMKKEYFKLQKKILELEQSRNEKYNELRIEAIKLELEQKKLQVEEMRRKKSMESEFLELQKREYILKIKSLELDVECKKLNLELLRRKI